MHLGSSRLLLCLLLGTCLLAGGGWGVDEAPDTGDSTRRGDRKRDREGKRRRDRDRDRDSDIPATGGGNWGNASQPHSQAHPGWLTDSLRDRAKHPRSGKLPKFQPLMSTILDDIGIP